MAPVTATEKLGRYEILSELGQGAMGVVYKAVDPLIDRVVAIKTIKFDGSKEEGANFEERFYREAKSAGRLNHPHIVTIYDVGKSDNTAYIAMEYLEGQQLKEILDVHTAMSIERIADIAAQIAEGLAYAHKNGIVHRDIKPANVMLVHGDMVKITDFGIAHMSASSGTLAGTILGSPRYMAPEQVVGKGVDGRSDLFALGVVLYEMLTGESPFDGDNINTTMYRIVNEAPVPPKTLVPRIPEVFDYIVAKALAKHPDARYQSAGEMAHDLRNYTDLVIPSPDVASLYHPITVDRRAIAIDRRAGLNRQVGEATVILTPEARAAVDWETPPQDSETISTQALAVQSSRQKRKIWMAASLILLVALSIRMWGDKSADPKKIALPMQTAGVRVTPLINNPAVVEQPVTDNSFLDPGSNSVVAPVVPDAATVDAPKPKIKFKPAPSLAAETETPVTPKAPPQKGEALLTFAVSPWGDVYLDGKRMGASPPLNELKVSAGRHKVEIRNQNFAPYSETLQLQADSTKKLKHSFQ